MGLEVIATAALAVSAASTVASISASRDQRKAQKEQRAQQGAVNQVQEREARQQAAREARVKRAQVLQASENLGVGGSSLDIGAQSNLAAGVSNVSGQQGFQKATANAFSQTNQKIADAQSQQQTWNAIGSLSGSIFSVAGGASSLFGTAATPTTPTPKT